MQTPRSKRKPKADPRVMAGRRACEEEFEPLWRCAPYVPARPGLSHLDRANIQAAAKRTAFVWLSEQIGRPIESFDALATITELEQAFIIIRRASINTVRAWADAKEAEI